MSSPVRGLKPVRPASIKAVTLGLLAIVLVGGLAVYIQRLSRPREYELQRGTITKLDFERRDGRIIAAHGEVEFVHPKSGRTMIVTGTVPADCPIYVDDAPGQLSDLRVGDTVAMRGTLHADRTLTPQWVRLKRRVTSQPVTTNATGNP